MVEDEMGRPDASRRPFRTEDVPPQATANPPARVWRQASTAAAPALLLAAALLLPFLGKAFTIDDTVFMRQAVYALDDPLHPSALTMVWSEAPRPMRLSQMMPTGPLMAWLLTPAALAGGSERIAHLTQVLLLALALVEVAALALRLGFEPQVARVASLFLASTPVVLGMAGTAMPDVAAMTFGLLGVERLCAWRDEGRPRQAVLAAIGLGLAPLARGHVFLLVALAPFLLARRGQGVRWRTWLPVIAAPALTLALLQLSRDPVGGSVDVLRSAGLFSSLDNVRSNAIAFGLHWVLVLPLGLAWMLARGRRFWSGPLPWLAVAAAVATRGRSVEAAALWIVPIAGLGVAVVADTLRDCIRQRDAGRIALGLWLLVGLPIVVYVHFPSKYLVASAPAAAILAASAVLAVPRPRAVALGAGLVMAGSWLGLSILRADAAFAGLGRRAAAELIAPRVAAGERVWFNGHWGFQWYAERAGARCLTLTPPHPARGDLVVASSVTIHGISLRSFPQREFLGAVTDDSVGGRIMSPELDAGFFSNAWGFLPWAWGATEIDRFELWRIH